jgi:hypothetical protein
LLDPTKIDPAKPLPKVLSAVTIINEDALADLSIGSVVTLEDIPLALKSNKALYASTDLLDVRTKVVDAGEIVDTRADLQVKLLKIDELRDSNNTQINLNNFGEGNFTKVSFEDLILKEVKEGPTSGKDKYSYYNQVYTTLNALIPEGHYGLIMFYNKPDSNSTGVYLTLSDEASTAKLTIFNKTNTRMQEE